MEIISNSKYNVTMKEVIYENTRNTHIFQQSYGTPKKMLISMQVY